MTTSTIGSINGLIIELFVYEPTNMTSLATSSGIRVIIHNQSYWPVFYEGISVSVGTHSQIQISRQFTSRLENPYSDCTQNIFENSPSDMVKIMMQTGNSYKQSDCFQTCFQFWTVERCNCFDNSIVFPFEIFTNKNITPCLTFNQTVCDAKVT